nr:hypothetical protein [Qaidamihabitans albus]
MSSTTTRRLAIVGVSVLSLAICCGLAWWQWERYSSAGGTFQNLGYVLQWPLFGLFPAFMFWRIRQLKRRQQEGREAPEPAAPPAPRPAARPAAPADDEDERDEELAAYNRYLAELNARDQEVN